MSKRGFFFILTFFLTSLTFAKEPAELSLHTDFELDPTPLTTERIWKLDPGEMNPHLRRWVLERRVSLMDLKPMIPEQDGFIRVQTSGIQSNAHLFMRGPGPWYRGISEFPCSAEPNSWFFTQEGAQKAGEVSATLWEKTLAERKLKLTLLLERVKTDSPVIAMKKGRDIFERWLSEVESEWRLKSQTQARRVEWKFYQKEASALGFCKKTKKSQPPPSLESMMESLSPEMGSPLLLARAPARRWDGMFSIRVSMDIAGKKLNGQFLLDSTAAMSVVSPAWLQQQGINPALIEIQGAPLRRVSWTGGGGLGRPVGVGSVQVSGFSIPLNEFLLLETDLFVPPEHIASCCDGILGLDFLRQHVVMFDPGPPVEVRLLDPAGFQLDSKFIWLEMTTDPDRGPVGESSMADLARGPFAFDIPHGRLWRGREGLAVPIHTNHSGLTLEYFYRDFSSDRVLRVTRIRPRSPAMALHRLGLRPGMEITQVDGKPAEDLDLWAVDQALAGVNSDTVTFQWKVRGDLKMAPFKVK